MKSIEEERVIFAVARDVTGGDEPFTAGTCPAPSRD